jgi:predicted secreted protein
MLNKTLVKIESIYDQDGDAANVYTLSGEAIITSISKTAGDNENVSYSVSLQGRGELVQTVVES